MEEGLRLEADLRLWASQEVTEVVVVVTEEVRSWSPAE